MATRTAKRTGKRTTRRTTSKTKRTTARKATRKAPRKTARKTTTTARKPKITGIRGKARSKTDTLRTIAEQTDLTRKQVVAVFDTMSAIMEADLKTIKQFQVPGLMKVVRVDKPAVKAHTRPNPFIPGEMMKVKAKPARKTIKVRPLKGLKDLV